jgi:RNA polymerase sigma-70 factor (ECF subfamily)
MPAGLISTEAFDAARAGNRHAFGQLVRTHQRLVYSIALRMVGNKAEADEVAQEAFLRLYDHLTDIVSPEHLAAWLRRVTANLAIDRLRARPTAPTVSSDDLELAAPESTDDLLLTRRLRALVLALPTTARAVMVLRYQQDMDPSDIAAALDLPLNTVKSHLKRSIDSLRERLSSRHDPALHGSSL